MGCFARSSRGHTALMQLKFLGRFKSEIINIDTLALASLKRLICQLVRLLSIFVDKSESFLVLFLIFHDSLRIQNALMHRFTHFVLVENALFLLK